MASNCALERAKRARRPAPIAMQSVGWAGINRAPGWVSLGKRTSWRARGWAGEQAAILSITDLSNK